MNQASTIPAQAPEKVITGDAIGRAKFLADALGLPRKLSIADIGANPMDHDSPYGHLLKADVCTVIGFEPQASAFDTLMKTRGPNERYFQAAIGDGSKQTLNLYQGGGLASTLRLRADTVSAVSDLTAAAEFLGDVDIETQRLDDIADLGPVDFLKIDIQGGELAVFENAKNTLKGVSAIQTEAAFFPLYEGQPMFADIDRFLRGQGFQIHFFPHIIRRNISFYRDRRFKNIPTRQVLDADVVYVRDFSKLDTISTEQMKFLAMIADGCFESFDLALRLLMELVERDEVANSDVRRYRSQIERDLG